MIPPVTLRHGPYRVRAASAGVEALTAYGDSLDMLTKAFRIAADDYQAAYRQLGRARQRSHSGEMMLRVSPRTHEKAATAADAGTERDQPSRLSLA